MWHTGFRLTWQNVISLVDKATLYCCVTLCKMYRNDWLEYIQISLDTAAASLHFVPCNAFVPFARFSATKATPSLCYYDPVSATVGGESQAAKCLFNAQRSAWSRFLSLSLCRRVIMEEFGAIDLSYRSTLEVFFSVESFAKPKPQSLW